MPLNKKMDNSTEKLIPQLRFPEFVSEGEWEEKKFEELFEIGNGRDYKHLEKGKIPVYGSGGYMLSVNDYLYNGESVCIGRKGTIHRPMFLRGKFWTVDTLFYTHSFKDCSPKFIYYIFQNIDWLKHNEAGGVPSLSKSNLYKIKTSVPKTNEQQKIAACLTSLDEVIAAHSQRLDALKEHKKGLMQNLFPQEGETVPKWRFPEFMKDGEWKNDILINLATNGFSNGVFNDPKKVGTGYKLVNVIDMYRESTINEKNLSLLELSQTEFEKNKVEDGDIFFTRSSLVAEGIAKSNIYLGTSECITYDGHLEPV